MARKPTAAGVGHNVVLTDDERAALKHYYVQKIMAQVRVAAEAAAVKKTADKALNGLFMSARGEIGILRKDFEEDIRLLQMSPAEFAAHEASRDLRLKDSGLKKGEQMELGLGDTADDKANAYQAGYRAGLRGDDGVCPDSIAPILKGDWDHGWADGQAELGAKLGVAEGVLARLKEAAAPKVVELEPVPDDRDDGEVIDDAAAKLKREGWANPSEAEATVGETADASELEPA